MTGETTALQSPCSGRSHGIHLLHLADVINRFDFIDNVVRHVDRSRFEAEVCTFSSQSNILSPEYGPAGISHKVLKITSRRDYPMAALHLAALCRRRGIEIVHAHHYEPNVLAWLATNLHRSTRVVVGRHYSNAIELNSSGLKGHTLLGIQHLVNHHATRIIVPSTMIRDLLVEHGVPGPKIDVIPYPFDPARYAPLSQEERSRLRTELNISSTFAVATVGRLYRDKGHRYMVDALRQLRSELPDLIWLVVGDGPDRSQLEEALRHEDLRDRVRLLGWRTDALQVLGAADAVVQPSLQEAYSQVMAEALWMRMPLVMTDVSGAPDLIQSGETGLLVPTADASALANALRLLYRDAELRYRLGRQGRDHVERHLSLDAIVPRYEDAYEQVMGL